jgi:hypothetical protein
MNDTVRELEFAMEWNRARNSDQFDLFNSSAKLFYSILLTELNELRI